MYPSIDECTITIIPVHIVGSKEGYIAYCSHHILDVMHETIK